MFPAFDPFSETWCRGCGMCNSSEGVDVKLRGLVTFRFTLFYGLSIFFNVFFIDLAGIPVQSPPFFYQIQRTSEDSQMYADLVFALQFVVVTRFK